MTISDFVKERRFVISKQELISMSKQLGKQIEEMRKQRQEEMNDKKEMIDQIP